MLKYTHMFSKIIITIAAIAVVFGATVYVKRESLVQFWEKRNLPPEVASPAQKKIGFVNGSPEIIDILPVNADLKLNSPQAPSQSPDAAPAADEPALSQNRNIPAEYNLAVPFVPQAPNGVWDEIHEEACEEASVLMSYYYATGAKPGSVSEIDADLLKIVDWEQSNFGFWKDTDAAKTAEILEKVFGLKNTEVKYGITIDDVKLAIAQGYPVILPAAGRLLGNPNFTPPGPLYHMIVAKGYTKDAIIANDPGTRNGKDYIYKNDALYNAIHDWNGGDVLNGQKAMIIVK